MTHIETARYVEFVSLQISAIRKAAEKLNASCELQELENNVAELEQAIADLKASMSAVPHGRA